MPPLSIYTVYIYINIYIHVIVDEHVYRELELPPEHVCLICFESGFTWSNRDHNGLILG